MPPDLTEWIAKAEASEALRIAKTLRAEIRWNFGLATKPAASKK